MIVNIITKQHNRTRITGPKKVLENTCKGFDLLGVKYVFNEPIAEHTYNWIHDDARAIIEASLTGKPVVVGPNTAVLAKDLPLLRKRLHPKSVYLHPSQWCIDVWEALGGFECPLKAWPAGIDTEAFAACKRTFNNKAMVYFKQRDPELLERAKATLSAMGIEIHVIHYGYYKEADYKKLMEEVSFCVWIGCTESQGIGLQEALATDLPMIVVDATSLLDTVHEHKKGYFDYMFPPDVAKVKATTVPYFDKRCGIVIEDIAGLENAVETLRKHYNGYHPRAFIEHSLSIAVCTKQLVDILKSAADESIHGHNYQKLSNYLYFSSLLFQKWAWKWVLGKLLK